VGISGRLEDLSAADALQFFHMSARSGQLTFVAGESRAWLALRDGRITGASLPGRVPPVGKLLSQGNVELSSRIDEVVRSCAGQGKALGAALIEAGVITTEQLRSALMHLIRMVVGEVIQWTRGTFSFEAGLVERGDDISYVPEELLPDIAVDVQDVLLDALRSIDEAARGSNGNTIPSPPSATSEGRWSFCPGATGFAEDGFGSRPERPAGAPPVPRVTEASASAREETVRSDPARASAPRASVSSPSPSLATGSPSRPAVAAAPVSPSADKSRKTVVVLTSDGFFRYGISAAWAEADFALKLSGLEQQAGHDAAELVAGGADVVAIIHASGNDAWSEPKATSRCIRRIKSLAPSVPVLVIGKLEPESQREAFRLGARHVLAMPAFDRNMKAYLPQFQLFAAGLRDAVSGTFEDLAGNGTFVGGATSDVKRLALKIEGLRRSTEKRAVALGLLEYVAENVERAVMFLVSKEGGTVIGAFGNNGELPLSALVVGLRLNYDDAPVLRSVVDTGQAFRGSVEPEVIGCVEFFERAGRPRTGHAVFLPVRGVSRVFAALYLDNGSRTVPLVSTEALQILSAHAGLMLENLALQRAAMGAPSQSTPRVEAAKPVALDVAAPVPAARSA